MGLPNDKHLEWLVRSRADNQSLSLKLLKLMREHELLYVKALRYDTAIVAQMLVSIAFSLWRAAFLADRDPNSGPKHAIEFLEKLILDNAINYVQDRNARDWTWAYYTSNAIFHLNELKDIWKDFDFEEVDIDDSYKRWTGLHDVFSKAVDRFEKDLRATGRASKNKKAR